MDGSLYQMDSIIKENTVDRGEGINEKFVLEKKYHDDDIENESLHSLLESKRSRLQIQEHNSRKE